MNTTTIRCIAESIIVEVGAGGSAKKSINKNT